MTEDPRIREIRAVLTEYVRPDDLNALHDVRRRVRAIVDREPPAPRVLGPEHEYAISVARSAVLKAARKFATAADMYRKRDLIRSVQEMADSERACVRVAQFLADEIASVHAERQEVQS